MSNNAWHPVFAQHFASATYFSVHDIAGSLLPGGCAAPIVASWRLEIALQADLMVLRGELIALHFQGQKLYRRGPRFPLSIPSPGERIGPPASLPARLVALTLSGLALAACAHSTPPPLPNYFGDETDGLPARRLEQFGLGNGAVYRLCTNACPDPTAKRWVGTTPFAPIQPAGEALSASPPPNMADRIAAQIVRQAQGLPVTPPADRAKRPDRPGQATRAHADAPAETSVPSPGETAPIAAPAASSPRDANSPEALLQAWLAAWSARDAQAYFGLYASRFVPQDGSALADWRVRRGAALNRTTRIEASLLPHTVRVSGDHASVQFWQTYVSPRFKSRVLKSLQLVREEGIWKIRRERVIPLAPRAQQAT